MLEAIPVLNSASWRFDSYHRSAIAELDRAGGRHFTIWRIGSPRGGGSVHKSLRSELLVQRDARDEDEWTRDVEAGTEDERRSEELMRVRETFEVDEDDIPCLIFFTHVPEPRRVGLLRISPLWYESDASWGRFCQRFCRWLQRSDVKLLCTSDPGSEGYPRRLDELLDHLRVPCLRNLGVLASEPILEESALKSADLSESERALLELMYGLQFGRIEGLVMRRGEPVMDPPPKISHTMKPASRSGPAADKRHFGVELPGAYCSIVRQLRIVRNGVVECIEVQAGLPVLVSVRTDSMLISPNPRGPTERRAHQHQPAGRGRSGH